MKHASMLAATEDMSMETAKEIHSSLRRGAGYLSFVQDVLLPQLVETPESESDLDPKVLVAYLNQCMAEAQEVTMGRAIELKHNASLIATLAHETFKMYTTAGDAISGMDAKKFGHWRSYFKLKCAFYKAYHKIDAATPFDHLKRLTSSNQRARNPSKPHLHYFFRKLGPIVERTLQKCERENSLIYHEKVPFDPIELEENAKAYGLVSPEPFSLPEFSPLWRGATYAGIEAPVTKEK
ncbi:Uncharacterized protein FKW44_015418, partial [Caligus rogercresseyi]